MSTLFPIAGSKIFIGTNSVEAKGEVTAADFTGVVWIEIKGWTNAGELGDTQAVGEQSIISESRVRKYKSLKNGGTMGNQFVPIPDDPGQMKFKEAIDSCAPYPFKVEWAAGCGGEVNPEGMTDHFFGLALPGARSGGDAAATHLRSWSIAVDSNILEI